MMIVILLCAAALAAGIGLFVVSCRRHEERRQYYSAAKALVQSDILEYEIQNHETNKLNAPKSRRILLYLKVASDTHKKYVLDPQKGITFGRDSKTCDVLLNEATVSEHHCRIYEQGGRVWLTDLGSSNGTTLRKGLFHTVRLHGGQSVRVTSGDRLMVGSAVFELTLFLFDNATM